MANSDKNIRIETNKGKSGYPNIAFIGSTNDPIYLYVLDDNTISFEGSTGQLFSVSNSVTTGTIFSVNDISGIPSLRIDADGTVGIAEFSGNVGVGTVNPLYKLDVNGDINAGSGKTLRIGGTRVLDSTTLGSTVVNSSLTGFGTVTSGTWNGTPIAVLYGGTGATTAADARTNLSAATAGTNSDITVLNALQRLLVTIPTATGIGITVRGATSQTGNLQQWQNSSASNLSWITSAGTFSFGASFTHADGRTPGISVQKDNAAGIVARGFNSDAYPAIEVQNNPGSLAVGLYPSGLVYGGVLQAYSSTASTNTTTGSLIVAGGAGIAGSINAGGVSRFTSATASTSSATGGVVFSGGIGVGLTSYFASSVFIQGTTASGSTSTGALVVTGGVGIGGSLQVTGTIDVADHIEILSQKEVRFFNSANTFYTGLKAGSSSANVTFTLPITDGSANQVLYTNGSAALGWTSNITGTATSAAQVNIDASTATRFLVGTVLNTASGSTQLSTGSGITIGNNLLTSGGIAVTNTTASTSTTTGALIVTGGVGIGGTINIGGKVGINTGVYTGAFNITTPSASTPGLVFQGSTSQTADYLQILSSAGTTSLTIDSSYKIAWPNTGTNPAKIYGTTYSTQGRVVVEGNLFVSTGPFIVNTGGGEASMSSTAISFAGGVGWGTYGSPVRVNTDNAVRIQPTSTSVVPLVVQLQNASWTSGNAFEIQNNGVLKFNVDYAGSTSILSTVGSASTTTGALVVTGGVGIGGSLNVFGTIDVSNNIEILAQKEVRFFNSGNTFYTGLKSGSSSANVTFTLPTADGTSNQALITNGSAALGWTSFVTAAITSLNGLTAATQTFATGTSGSDFNISSSTSTHTFNIPYAGAASTGLITTNAQTIAGAKTFSSALIVSNTTASTGFSSGSLLAFGGVGISGNLNVNGTGRINSSTASTSSSSGALVVAGGIGVGQTSYFASDEYVQGELYFNQATVGAAGTTVIPSIAFIGQTNNPITLSILADNTLSFEGSSGQLFSINNNLSSGTIFSVNDISGLPILRANANGTLSMAEFGTSVGVGTSLPGFKLHVMGDINIGTGYTYRINGTKVIDAISLGSAVVSSSLTSVGTLTSGTWNATTIGVIYGGTGQTSYTDGQLLIGSSTGGTLIKSTLTAGSGILITNASGAITVSTTGAGITNLNGLSGSYQTLAVGSSGSDFNISSSGSSHTFNIPDASGSNRGLVTTGTQTFAGSKTFSNDVTVTGNLTINGTTTTVNSTISTLVDPVFTLGTATGGTNPGTDDNKDRGIEFKYFSGTAKTGFFGFDDSTGFFTFIPDAANSSEVFSGTTGVIDATRITGTAAAWTNAITFSLGGDLSGSVSFSGTGNTTLTATIAANSVALGTDTTGQYASTIAISGSGITATSAAGDDGTAYTIYSSAVSTNTASAIVLRDGSGNFSAGTITANLSGTATSAQVLSTVTDTSSNLYFLGSRSSTGFAGTQVYVDTSVYAIGATLYATTFNGALQGNAATATTASFADQLTTPRTISLGGDLSGSVVFSGAGNTTLTATIAANSVALGTDTTGQYAETITISGSGITATSAAASDGTGYTIYSSAVSTNTSSAIVLRDGSGNFSAGTITASLTGTASTSTNATTTALSGTMYLTGTLISGAASGGTALQVGSGLSFASSSGTLTATTFSGSLSGTATSSQVIATTTDTTSTLYLLGSRSSTGFAGTAVYVDTGISALGNTLTATTFVGSLTGTATTATNATNVIFSADTTNTNRRLLYSYSGTGSSGVFNTGTLFVNPSTSAVGASIITATSSLSIRPGIDAASGVSIGNSAGTAYVYFDTTNNRVGINTATPQYDLHIIGEISATNKSFVIDHPTKEGMHLRYGSLEGPENGVYVRGKLIGCNTIELPEYWTNLVDFDSISVNLTPIGRFSQLYVEKIENNTVYVQDNCLNPIKCYFTVYAERIDIPKLEVEY